MPALRYLIADPSHALQTFMQKLLVDHGFDAALIRTASTSEVALAMVEDHRPDLLITDWFDGAEHTGIGLYRKLRTLNPGAQFALLSKTVTDERHQEATAAGAVFLQIKPCSAQDLRAALRQGLEKLAPKHAGLTEHFQITPGSDIRERVAQANRVVAQTLPQFQVGQPVIVKGHRDKVKYVILRRGEMVVALHNQPGLVPATEVRPA